MLFIKGNKLYTIQWLNDKEIIGTTGYQIGAIQHCERKYCDSTSIINILREANTDDINKYRYEGETFLCPKK